MAAHRALLPFLVAATLTAGFAPAFARPATAIDAPALERISFAPSASRPGTVVRLHFSQRVDSFLLERQTDQRTVQVSATGAVPGGAFACDPLVRPFVECSASADDGHLRITLGLSGVVSAADIYRDARYRDHLLVYVEAVASPLAPERIASGPGLPDRPPAEDAGTGQEERLAQSAERQLIDTVVIDAGHGGHDPGTIGYGGMKEKDLVLDIALRVGRYLEERADVRVVYTRDDDRFIKLEERGAIARRAGGKLFVSIHANAARSRTARGTETFFLGTNRTAAAQEVIERENSVIELEDDPGHYAKYDPARLVKIRLTQSANLEQSRDLATRMQLQYRDRVGREDRRVKEGPLVVLWSAGMPAVLTEVGFITNPAEARFLASDEGKDFIASAIFRAIRDYKQAYEAGLEVVTSR